MPRYIDAEQAIRLIKIDDVQLFGYTKRDAIDCINATPTANVQEVRRGHWNTDRFGMERAVCSLCGATYEGGDDWKYCPHCGAKMDGEE